MIRKGTRSSNASLSLAQSPPYAAQAVLISARLYVADEQLHHLSEIRAMKRRSDVNDPDELYRKAGKAGFYFSMRD